MSEQQTASGKRRRRDRYIAFCRDRNGATAVEFALVGPPFLALFVGIIQIFLVFFGQQLLEQVTQQAGRLIMTGQAQAQQLSQTQFHQKVCDQVVVIFSCGSVMVNVESYADWSSASTAAPTLTFNAQGQVTNAWQYSPGNPGDIVIVTVAYQWPVFMGPLGFNLANLSTGNRLLAATAAFQNEP